ncbi:Gfo/Idh/MocA family protein [Pseudozobellia thermophila]|uniref:Predicted dehydrogenase n=1 Tax=Pseudozobellia thermophila TaxID=192903 RepID=A0A1M6LCD5_9FLAO|nr:Gfo/Idh/MocA family oxidoreductase [Pseudozobellia thermophila]SHJ68920.1 Predicted dehydrogenase [Pseudozobellia thermophila]
MSNEIRWGIVGPGRIAHSFADDLRLVGGGRLTAVASRDLGRAKDFAKEYGAESSYGSYREIFESDAVDALYIATPHTSHCELSVQAMNHGKHVLCEKPMGVNLPEVEKMVAAAQENQVFLMEALWSRFNPSIVKAKQLVDEGVLGDVSYVNANFGFYALDRDKEGRLLNPRLAGGSLLDIGIYPIFLAYLLLGKPQRIEAISKFHATGVEAQTAMIFDYPYAQAVLSSGLRSKISMKAEIAGSKGSLYLKERWHETQGYMLELNGDEEAFDLPTKGRGYSHEIEEVHDCLNKGRLQSERWSWRNSVDLATLLDEVRRITGVTFPFE